MTCTGTIWLREDEDESVGLPSLVCEWTILTVSLNNVNHGLFMVSAPSSILYIMAISSEILNIMEEQLRLAGNMTASMGSTCQSSLSFRSLDILPQSAG
eukprot:scaffold255488_cov63-Attheya_sp.AAC.4